MTSVLNKHIALGVMLAGLSVVTAQTAFAVDWETTLQKAKTEGKVVLGTNQGDPAFRQEVSTLFKNRYGIDVEVRSVPTGVDTIIIRECQAGNPTLDLQLGGVAESLMPHMEKCLLPVPPNLLLPEVTDLGKWRGGKIKYAGKGEYMLQTAEYVSITGIYNSKALSAQQMKSIRVLADPSLKGKIATFDPRTAGSGLATASYLLEQKGEPFVKEVYIGQEAVNIANHRQLADTVARSSHFIGLAALERAFRPLIDQGLPVEIMNFEDLRPKVTGGSSVVEMVKNSPHPNAAVVLVNWLASKEGQEVYEKHTGQKSRRLDVRQPATPDYSIPKDGIDYFDDYSYENYLQRIVAQKRLIEILGR